MERLIQISHIKIEDFRSSSWKFQTQLRWKFQTYPRWKFQKGYSWIFIEYDMKSFSTWFCYVSNLNLVFVSKFLISSIFFRYLWYINYPRLLVSILITTTMLQLIVVIIHYLVNFPFINVYLCVIMMLQKCKHTCRYTVLQQIYI